MTLELLGRIHKELSITGSALYEAILAIAERVNRKVQIIRLHAQASAVLERMERLAEDVGAEVVRQVARRTPSNKSLPTVGAATLDAALSRAVVRVRDLKQTLVQLDARIRELKLEAIYQDLLRLQRDLSLRSAVIERITIGRRAAAVGQPVRAVPRPASVHLAVILRGPFLLAPTEELIFRPDDIVVVIGLQADVAQVSTWLTTSVSTTSVPVTAGRDSP